ncbi:hypothetical protein SAMN05216563_111106 [Phytobacter palmae]|nr:hypothetical protein SAMN05216563_111106 [Phytobacter palmae]
MELTRCARLRRLIYRLFEVRANRLPLTQTRETPPRP